MASIADADPKPSEAPAAAEERKSVRLRLSVLDQSPIAQGSSGAQALRNTLELAQLADRLGYHRYWVAEHHGGPMLAGPSPEALIGPIAALYRERFAEHAERKRKRRSPCG